MIAEYITEIIGNVASITGANGGTTTYTYDLAGNRTQETSPLGYVTAYTYDKEGNVLTRTDADGKRLSVELGYADGTARATINVSGEYGENPQSDIAMSIHKAWYRTSHLNSTLFAVEADGSVVAHMIYDPWGAPLLETYTDTNYSGLDNLNNFTGYAYDEVLGFYFAQNRFYDAATHRFTQEDAVKDGGNWYAYCGDDPLNYVDEDGQVFFLATAAIGAAIGGLVGGVTAGVREYKDAKASGLSGKDLAKRVAASAGKSALAGAAAGGAIGLGAGALAAAATAGAAATTAAVTATTAGKAAAIVALATTTSTSWQQGEKIGQGQKLTAGSVLTDTARNATTAIAYTIPETRVVVGTVNAVKSGNEAIAAAKSGNTKQAVISGASAALNAAAAASGVKEIAPKVSGYFEKAQCPVAGQAVSGGYGYQITWNKSINATQEMIEGTNIPKSFTIKDAYVNGKEVWVHGNATKHMGEYINSANGSVIVENELMISFQDSVSQILPNVQPGRNFFHINGWEIGINGDTGVIYHALYK